MAKRTNFFPHRVHAVALLWVLSLCLSGTAEERMRILPQIWERNGAQTVPMGLLGVHNVPLDEETAADWGVTGMRKIHQSPGPVTRIPEPGRREELRAMDAAETNPKEKRRLKKQADYLPSATYDWVMDCFYDRYQPALQVTDPNGWEPKLRERVRTFVANARKSGQQHYLEFWNEPYLNWATNPAVNVSPQYYVTEGIKEGDPMVLKANGKVVPGLEWGPKRFYVVQNGGIHYVLSGYIQANAKPGEETTLRYGAGRTVLEIGGTVHLRGQDRQLGYGHWGRDVEQKHYWAGPVSVNWYNEMFRVVGEEMAALGAEDISLAGGWGFNFFNEGWDSWHRLIKPLIDTGHPWLDALHEHHYGGDVRKVGCSYEVAYSYALATYGNRLEFWNTEAGGHLDPQQPGNVKPHNLGDPLTKAKGSMTYFLRDVIYQWAHVPDKAIFRAAHHSHHTEGGDPIAFRLLKPMAGDLLVVDNPMNNVWAVASRGGTATTMMLFNDRRGQVSFTLDLPVQRGEAKLASIVTQDGALTMEETEVSFQNGQLELSIPGISALRVTLPSITPESTLQWTQYASADVLQSLNGGFETTMVLPEGGVGEAQGAVLRLVLDKPQTAITLLVGDATQTLEDLPFGISDHPLSDEVFQQLQKTGTVWFQGGTGMLMSTSLWIQD